MAIEFVEWIPVDSEETFPAKIRWRRKSTVPVLSRKAEELKMLPSSNIKHDDGKAGKQGKSRLAGDDSEEHRSTMLSGARGGLIEPSPNLKLISLRVDRSCGSQQRSLLVASDSET